jgi:hypothetical protein
MMETEEKFCTSIRVELYNKAIKARMGKGIKKNLRGRNQRTFPNE